MSVLRTVTRNVLSNWAGYMVSAAVAFALTPFMIDCIGKSAWAVWSMLVVVTGYYGLLDLGVRSAVAQYVTRYWAKGDIDGVSRTMSTALGILLMFGAGLVPLALGLAWFAPRVFELEGVSDDTARLTFAIIGVGVAIDLPLKIFQTATYARQRFDIANAVGISQRLVAAGLTYLALDLGYGLLTLSVVHVGTNIVGNLARIVVAYRMLPGLQLRRAHWSRSSVHELFSFGVFNVLVNAADQIQVYGAILIIPLWSSTALAHFTAGATPVPYMLNLVNAIAWTLTPQATTADAQGNSESLRSLWLVGSRAVTTFAAMFAAGFVFMGSDFLRLWLGAEFVDGELFISSAVILGVLAIGNLFRCMLSTAKQICFGMREVRFLSRVTFGEAMLNLVLTFVLTWQFGILGAAVAGLIALLLTQAWMLPLFVARRLEMRASEFFGVVPWAPLMVFATMGVLAYVTHDLLQVQGWGTFLMKVCVLGIPSAAVGIAYGTTTPEKQRILRALKRAG